MRNTLQMIDQVCLDCLENLKRRSTCTGCVILKLKDLIKKRETQKETK